MKTLKDKIFELPKGKELYTIQKYARLVALNVWEEYAELWYDIEDITDHVYEALLEQWYIKEHREMMIYKRA